MNSCRVTAQSTGNLSYESALLAAVRRQIETFEEKVGSQINTLQSQQKAIYEAAFASLEVKLSVAEAQQPKLDRRLAELTGNFKGLADEMQSQIRRVDQFDERGWEWRRQFEEESRQRHQDLEQGFQKLSASMRVATATSEDVQKRYNQRMQRLERAVEERLAEAEAEREGLVGLSERLSELEDLRAQDLAICTAEPPRTTERHLDVVEALGDSAVKELLERRIDEVSQKVEMFHNESQDLHTRVEGQEELLKLLRTRMEAQQDNHRSLINLIERVDPEARIKEVQNRLSEHDRSRTEHAERLEVLLKRVEGHEQMHEDVGELIRRLQLGHRGEAAEDGQKRLAQRVSNVERLVEEHAATTEQDRRLRETAFAKLQEKTSALEDTQPRWDRRLAELAGNFKGLSEEVLAQIRSKDLLDERLREWRRQIDEESGQRHKELQDGIQRVQSAIRIVTTSTEDGQKRLAQRIIRLEGAVEDRRLLIGKTRELAVRLEQAEVREAELLLQLEAVAPKVIDHEQLVLEFGQRLEDLENAIQKVKCDLMMIPASEVTAHETRKLGQGASAEVFEGIYRGCRVAVKKFRANGFGECDMKEFEREAKILAQVIHPNCMRVVGACVDSSVAWLILELLEGTLHEAVRHNPDRFNVELRMRFAHQAADALSWLHHRVPGILHRDIKSNNMLIDRTENLKISDFGLARTCSSVRTTSAAVIVGTPDYMAPEIFEGKAPDQAADVYALGIVLHELIMNRTPTDGLPPHQATALAQNGVPVSADRLYEDQALSEGETRQFPMLYCNVVKRCVAKAKDDRMTSAEIAMSLRSMPADIKGGLASGYAQGFDGDDGAIAVVSLIGETGKWNLVAGTCKEKRYFFRGVWQPWAGDTWEQLWKDAVLELSRRQAPQPRCSTMLVITYDAERDGTKLGKNMRDVEVPFLVDQCIPHEFRTFSRFMREFSGWR